MKNNILTLLLTLCTLTSCQNKLGVHFEIYNNTKYEIDSLKIEPNTTESDKFISINKKESVQYKTDMTKIEKIDGAYQLSFLINGEKRLEKFGYYTNGYPLEKFIRIKIENDTVRIEY